MTPAGSHHASVSPPSGDTNARAGVRVAVVTDGMWRKSLSAIRSLGKAGFRVHVLGDSILTVGFWSRFTSRHIATPDAKENPDEFGARLAAHLRALAAAMPAGTKPVLLPMEEDSLRYVVAHGDALRAFADFLVPAAADLEVCLNKGATMALAERLGIPHPRTSVAETSSDLCKTTAEFAGREFVVKPVRGLGSSGVRYNPTFDSRSAEEYWRTFGPALVQDRIPPHGDALGVSLLFGADGACLAHFCHKRLQQYPNSGGPSSDRISIEVPELLEKSLALMRVLRWQGIAMTEWKVDPRDGTPKLLEINPRFWGSLELAVRSGVDFPFLYAEAAAGRATPYPQPITGVRCRWLIPGDILRWLTAKRTDREPLRKFLEGLPQQAEEWDRADLPGTAACVICQGLAVLNPKYWKFLSR